MTNQTPDTSQDKLTRLAAALAQSAVTMGLRPPIYKRPKWWQFKQKRHIKWMRKNNLPFILEEL